MSNICFRFDVFFLRLVWSSIIFRIWIVSTFCIAFSKLNQWLNKLMLTHKRRRKIVQIWYALWIAGVNNGTRKKTLFEIKRFSQVNANNWRYCVSRLYWRTWLVIQFLPDVTTLTVHQQFMRLLTIFCGIKSNTKKLFSFFLFVFKRSKF